ncbi:hypothetical protein, partial [Neorhodopirellula pilleata]|uniref:hypothetical protein n=1 Tax=Neorhodopirellula pilleata TaxID=2714738 RepID=UPI001E30EB74
AYILSHPWPFEYWFGVRTSNFSEGLFRGKINFEVIGNRLKCRKKKKTPKIRVNTKLLAAQR